MDLNDHGPDGDDAYISDDNVQDEIEDVNEEEEEEEGEGEELIGADMDRDYRSMPALDDYEHDGLDEDFVQDVTYEEQQGFRRAADRALFRRDNPNAKRVPDALGGDDDDDSDFGTPNDRPRRRMRVERAQAGDMMDDEEEHVLYDMNIEYTRGTIGTWISQDRARHEIKENFRHFLHNFRDETKTKVYLERITRMVNENKQSLVVDYNHFQDRYQNLGIWISMEPIKMLELLNQVLVDLIGARQPSFSTGWGKEAYVRICHMPQGDTLRDLKHQHLNTLIDVRGVVTRRTSVFPMLTKVKYDCAKCGETLGPFLQKTEKEVKPIKCVTCQSRGPFTLNVAETIYKNYQRITLQESPGSVPPGMLPRKREVVLTQDLIDSARPGDEVSICGIYKNEYNESLNQKNGFPVFKTIIEANSVTRNEDLYSLFNLSDADSQAILTLSEDVNIAKRLFNSVSPSIHGHDYIKMAITLSMFGGVEKQLDMHKMRGDINVLLVGDSGVGKSRFLKYVEQTVQRSVYTTGKGASAVGLTAAVQKDPMTGEWTLEGGALVLADKGVCLIDEFDKMNDQDRVSIHEAMEQQSISISKAGIVTQLQARCAVIAAANPIGGRYDPLRPLSENVHLEDPILSRFDCMCVVRDEVDMVSDRQLASFVTSVHEASCPADVGDEVTMAYREAAEKVPASQEPFSQSQDLPSIRKKERGLIPQDLLKKYVIYARQHVRPVNQSEELRDYVASVYLALRRESATAKGMNITVRHLESINRMAEAHARMHLRNTVERCDVNVAVRMMVESFINSQKAGVQRELRRKLRKYLSYGRSAEDCIMAVLKTMVNKKKREIYQIGVENAPEYIKIPCRGVENEAAKGDVRVDWDKLTQSQGFKDSLFEYDERHQLIKVQWTGRLH